MSAEVDRRSSSAPISSTGDDGNSSRRPRRSSSVEQSRNSPGRGAARRSWRSGRRAQRTWVGGVRHGRGVAAGLALHLGAAPPASRSVANSVVTLAAACMLTSMSWPCAGLLPRCSSATSTTSRPSGRRCGSPGCRRRAPAGASGRRSRSSTPGRPRPARVRSVAGSSARGESCAERRDRHQDERGVGGRDRRSRARARPAAGRSPRARRRRRRRGRGSASPVGRRDRARRRAWTCCSATTRGCARGPARRRGTARSVRCGEPPGGSTTMTSAPRSASSLPAHGACSCASSTTRDPVERAAPSDHPVGAQVGRSRPATARAPRDRPARCARRAAVRPARCASRCAERCTGSPSTRTRPCLVWSTVGHSPHAVVSASSSMRSGGRCTGARGTPGGPHARPTTSSRRAGRGPRRRARRRARPRRRGGRRASPAWRPWPTARRSRSASAGPVVVVAAGDGHPQSSSRHG